MAGKRILAVLLLVGTWAISPIPTAAQPPGDRVLLNYDRPLAAILATQRFRSLSLLVEKSAYRLTVMADRKRQKAYPVVFGQNPVDDKLRSGDLCTPLGRFRLRAAYPHPHWSRFLWLDYPTADSWTKHKRAKAAGTIRANDQIGGEIGIHGVPEGQDDLIDRRENWTLGCISLKNRDVQEIFQAVKKGTVIEIVP
jgi:murein L,D-transpeptidase YafK